LSYKFAGFVSFSKQNLNSAGADTRNIILKPADTGLHSRNPRLNGGIRKVKICYNRRVGLILNLHNLLEENDMKLTNKQTETLAKRIAKEIREKNLKAYKDRVGKSQLLKGVEKLNKQLFKVKQEERRVEGLRDQSIEMFNNKLEKNFRLTVENSYRRSKEPDVIRFVSSSVAQSSWEVRQNIEDDLVIECIKQDNDIKSVMKTLVDRYTI